MNETPAQAPRARFRARERTSPLRPRARRDQLRGEVRPGRRRRRGGGASSSRFYDEKETNANVGVHERRRFRASPLLGGRARVRQRAGRDVPLVPPEDGGDARLLHRGGVRRAPKRAPRVLRDVPAEQARRGHRRGGGERDLALPSMPRVVRRRVRDLLQLRALPQGARPGADAPGDPARARRGLRQRARLPRARSHRFDPRRAARAQKELRVGEVAGPGLPAGEDEDRDFREGRVFFRRREGGEGSERREGSHEGS